MVAVVPVHGSKARLYYHKIDMSDYAEDIKATISRDQAQHKPFSASFVTVVPGQSMALILTIGGSPYIQDALATQAWTELQADAPRHFAYSPFGDSTGGVALCGKTAQNNHSINASKSDIVRLPIGVVGTDEFDLCDIVRALAVQSVSPSAYITGPVGGSTNGGAGYLIVTAVGAGATLTVTIGHSTNHIDWSNLVTFEAVTPATLESVASQQVVVAPLTTVNRYLRAEWTLTGGAATATFFVAFGRR